MGVVISIFLVTRDVNMSSLGGVIPGGSLDVEVREEYQLVSFLPINQPSCFNPRIGVFAIVCFLKLSRIQVKFIVYLNFDFAVEEFVVFHVWKDVA